MNLTSTQKETILKKYLEWSDKMFDDCDWLTSIPPEVLVQKIIDLVEEV